MKKYKRTNEGANFFSPFFFQFIKLENDQVNYYFQNISTKIGGGITQKSSNSNLFTPFDGINLIFRTL